MTKSRKQARLASRAFTIPGVSFATCCSGTKYENRDDLLLIVLDPGSHLSACFTLSTMPSAPVIWSKKIKKACNHRQKIVFW